MIVIYKVPNPEIEQTLKDNGGYCPCAIVKDEDAKCMCKAFREMKEGICPCGLYRKERSETHYPLEDPNDRKYSGLTSEE